ncbi:MAG: hypothetical protein ACKVX7_17355 [Planctomycetota bacterium]
MTFAQEHPPPPIQVEALTTIVVMRGVESLRRDDRIFVKVAAHALRAPAGTKVDFLLTWRSMEIDKFEATVNDDHEIHAEFQIGKLPRIRDAFYFRTVIHLAKQTPEVRSLIEKDPATFEPALNPWTDYHSQLRFRLLTAEEANQALAELRSLVAAEQQILDETNRGLDDAAKRAVGGEDFIDAAGRFDPERWKKWLGESVFAPLRALQQRVVTNIADPRYVPFRRALHIVGSFAEHSAARGVSETKQVLKELSPGLATEQFVPTDLALTPNRKPLSDREYDDLVAQLQIELDVVPVTLVENAFTYALGQNYTGVIFRRLEPDELKSGSFDEWRTRATWTPTTEDVAKFESQIAQELTRLAPERTGLAAGLVVMRRQYVGFDVASEQRLLCTFVHPRSPASRELHYRVKTPRPADELHFSLVYDPLRATASDLSLASTPPQTEPTPK